jgi:hypothetical protein
MTTEWNLKPDEMGDLHLVLPSDASGEANLVIQLVATDGAIIADAELAEAQVSDERAQAVGEKGAEGTLANLDAGTAEREPVPLPDRRLAKPSNDDAKWITLTSVNLRERPTRSARAIGVVAKDVRLRVIGRRNRWVQVTDPTTSEKGWIYARHVATVR